jgi:hypothetical protein
MTPSIETARPPLVRPRVRKLLYGLLAANVVVYGALFWVATR